MLRKLWEAIQNSARLQKIFDDMPPPIGKDPNDDSRFLQESFQAAPSSDYTAPITPAEGPGG